MIIYTVKYYKRYHGNAESVYTSIFKSEAGADNFIKQLEESGLDLVIEKGFVELEKDEKTAGFFFEQFKEIESF